MRRRLCARWRGGRRSSAPLSHRAFCVAAQQTLFPSPLAGEGGLRGAIASRAGRGGVFAKSLLKRTPLPTVLGFASARSRSPARGRGGALAARAEFNNGNFRRLNA